MLIFNKASTLHIDILKITTPILETLFNFYFTSSFQLSLFKPQEFRGDVITPVLISAQHVQHLPTVDFSLCCLELFTTYRLDWRGDRGTDKHIPKQRWNDTVSPIRTSGPDGLTVTLSALGHTSRVLFKLRPDDSIQPRESPRTYCKGLRLSR